MHLIVTGPDFGFFRHLHPEGTSEGLYTFTVTFPAGGQYAIYNEFETKNGQDLLYHTSLNVGGPTATPPAVNLAQTQQFGDVKATLALSGPVKAGQPVELTFNFERNGQPLTELEPYLGEPSHMIVLSQDGNSFRHLHGHAGEMGGNAAPGMNGGEMAEVDPGTRYGPSVGYELRFDQAGTYRVWAEFKYQGQILIFNYEIAVQN
jgi:hypothetical protein